MSSVTDKASAGRAKRVADRERPAVDIDLRGVKIGPSLNARERLRRERFVQFDNIDLCPRFPSTGECLIGGFDWRDGNRCGSTPWTARAATRASGSPGSAPSPANSTAEAPSLNDDELPAVTVPERSSSENSAGSPASFSIDVSSLMPSSRASSAPGTCTISSS